MDELTRKKFKELTAREMINICKQHERCYDCPLANLPCFGDYKPYSITNEELNKEIEFIRQRNYDYGIREYIVYFKKYYEMHYAGNIIKRYENCHVCIRELNSKSIQRVFNDGYTIVEEMLVKERATGKVIYKGNDYQEYLKVIGEYQYD